jgi:hypothetical protein
MTAALREAERLGQRCLLLSTRGSDRLGQDFAHAGLWSDLEAVLESSFCADVDHVDLLGYSLGGHLVLSYAAAQPHLKVRRVAAVGAPLLLEPIATALDYVKAQARTLHDFQGDGECPTRAILK